LVAGGTRSSGIKGRKMPAGAAEEAMKHVGTIEESSDDNASVCDAVGNSTLARASAAAWHIECCDLAVRLPHEAVIHAIPVDIISDDQACVADLLREGPLVLTGTRSRSVEGDDAGSRFRL